MLSPQGSAFPATAAALTRKRGTGWSVTAWDRPRSRAWRQATSLFPPQGTRHSARPSQNPKYHQTVLPLPPSRSAFRATPAMSKRKSDQAQVAGGGAARAAKTPVVSDAAAKLAEQANGADGEHVSKRATRRSLAAAAEAAGEKENTKSAPQAANPAKEKKRKNSEPEKAEGYKRPTTKPVVGQATLQAVTAAAKEAKKALSKPMSRPVQQPAAEEEGADEEEGARAEAAPPAKRGRREVRFMLVSLSN